jgi:hypothetical protein
LDGHRGPEIALERDTASGRERIGIRFRPGNRSAILFGENLAPGPHPLAERLGLPRDGAVRHERAIAPGRLRKNIDMLIDEITEEPRKKTAAGNPPALSQDAPDGAFSFSSPGLTERPVRAKETPEGTLMPKPIPKAQDTRDILTIRADDMRDNWRFAGKALAILLDRFGVTISHVGREEGSFETDKTLVRMEAFLEEHTAEVGGRAEVVIFNALRDILTTSHGATIELPGIPDVPFTFTGEPGGYRIDASDARMTPDFPIVLRKAIPAQYTLGAGETVSAADFWIAFELAVELLAASKRDEDVNAEDIERIQRGLQEDGPGRWHQNPSFVRAMTEIALRIPDGIMIVRNRGTGRGAIVAYEASQEDGHAIEWGIEKNMDGQPRRGYLLARYGNAEKWSVSLSFSTNPWRFVRTSASEQANDISSLRRLLRRLSRIERQAAKNPARRGLKHATIDAFMEFLR